MINPHVLKQMHDEAIHNCDNATICLIDDYRKLIYDLHIDPQTFISGFKHPNGNMCPKGYLGYEIILEAYLKGDTEWEPILK